MSDQDPSGELDARYSGEDATPTPWTEAERRLDESELSWLTTVRPDGRPHVTPLIFLWLEGAAYFATGEQERKAMNLATNTHVAITTGCNALEEGLDVVIEGEAADVEDEETLRRVADAFASKYVPREGAKP